MSFFVNLVALALPIFTMQVYDRVIGHRGFSTLQGLVIGMLVVLIFDFVLRQARSRIMQTVALRVDVEVGRRLFQKFMSLPLQTLEGRNANHWQALFRDVDVVRNTLSGSSAILICDIPFALIFLGVILAVAAPIAWVLLIVLPAFMFVAWRSAGAMASANKQERDSSMTRDGLIAEMIAGRSTIKALALDRTMGPLWEEKHAENIENAIARGSKTDTFQNIGASLTMITTIAMTSVGAIAIITQLMTMGALVSANMLSGRLLGPLNQLVGQWRSFSQFKQSVDRLGEVFSSEGERQESEVKLGRPRGELTAEAVTFTYAKDLAPVVDSVSIVIKAGGIHALVGRNGSGKTTLMKLLLGLYRPTSGRVLIDGADIAQFTRAELATWMGYVPQDCVLFAGTVRDNIAYRVPDATDEQVIKAATAAGVHHFIIDLPDGYASDIGEAGRRLSGGQRQRIAIARALVGEPAIVMLDEPSSSLDRQAEQELRTTLAEIGRERTVIIVTHSPILLAACDDLVALDRGKVALAGPSKEILPRLFGQSPAPKPEPVLSVGAPPPAIAPAIPRPQPSAAGPPLPPSVKPSAAGAPPPRPPLPHMPPPPPRAAVPPPPLPAGAAAVPPTPRDAVGGERREVGAPVAPPTPARPKLPPSMPQPEVSPPPAPAAQPPRPRLSQPPVQPVQPPQRSQPKATAEAAQEPPRVRIRPPEPESTASLSQPAPTSDARKERPHMPQTAPMPAAGGGGGTADAAPPKPPGTADSARPRLKPGPLPKPLPPQGAAAPSAPAPAPKVAPPVAAAPPAATPKPAPPPVAPALPPSQAPAARKPHSSTDDPYAAFAPSPPKRFVHGTQTPAPPAMPPPPPAQQPPPAAKAPTPPPQSSVAAPVAPPAAPKVVAPPPSADPYRSIEDINRTPIHLAGSGPSAAERFEAMLPDGQANPSAWLDVVEPPQRDDKARQKPKPAPDQGAAKKAAAHDSGNGKDRPRPEVTAASGDAAWTDMLTRPVAKPSRPDGATGAPPPKPAARPPATEPAREARRPAKDGLFRTPSQGSTMADMFKTGTASALFSDDVETAAAMPKSRPRTPAERKS